jgi:hypothetical protein
VRVFDDSELPVMAVEAGIEPAAKLCEAATETATVRVDRLAVVAADGVVRPVATLTTQAVAAGIAAVPMVKTIWAVVWPEFETAAVKVEVPQPVSFSAVGADEPDREGTTSVTVSACARAMPAEPVKAYDTADAVEHVAVAKVRVDAVRENEVIAGELETDAAEMGAQDVVSATVRVAKFCAWAASGAVRPVSTLMTQAVVPVAAVPTVKTICAFVWPELVTAAVKVAVAHPVSFSAVGADAPIRPGTTKVMVSAWLTVLEDVKPKVTLPATFAYVFVKVIAVEEAVLAVRAPPAKTLAAAMLPEARVTATVFPV